MRFYFYSALVVIVSLMAPPALAEGSAASETPSKTQEAKQAVKKGARAVGAATRKAARAVGHGARDATKAIGHGARDAAHGVGDTAWKAWDEVKR